LDHVTIAHLKVFRDIAQSRSISQAAELNHISQSAASQSLKSLEKLCGVGLVDRDRRPLRLTHAGEIYLEASRDIVRRFEELESRLASHKQQLCSVVRVASIYSIGLYEMARLRDEFEKLHGGAKIHLEYMRPDKIYEALEQDRADLGLVSYPNATRELRAIDWRLEKMVFVCHPTHPLAGAKSIKPSDLARTDFVSFDRGLQIRRALDRFFREHGVQREVAYEFDNIQMIKEALSIGQGVSILPERTVRQEVMEGRLVALPIEAEGLVRPVGILLQRKKKLSKTGELFLDFLRASAA
jgi:LysR family transcriptional regulator, transcriptional activator of the cysJI operon